MKIIHNDMTKVYHILDLSRDEAQMMCVLCGSIHFLREFLEIRKMISDETAELFPDDVSNFGLQVSEELKKVSGL